MPRLDTSQVARPVGRPQAGPEAFGAAQGRELVGAGRAVSALGQTAAAWSEQTARVSAARYQVALQDRVDDLARTAPLEDAEKAFDTARKQLADEFRGGSRGVFDREAGLAADRARTQYNHRIRTRMINEGRTAYTEELRLYADQMAQAEDPTDRMRLMQRAEVATEKAVTSGLVGEQESAAFLRNFEQQSMAGILRRLQNDDPAAGLAYLESGQFAGTEQERQVWRGHMMAAQRTRVNAQLSEIRRRDALEARAERERRRAHRISLVERSFAGGFTEEDVLAGAADYDNPAELERDLRVARQGGVYQASESNLSVWDELRTLAGAEDVDQALDGETFEDLARDALRRGELTQSDYTGLLTLYEDTRITNFLDLIDEGVTGGGPFVGPAGKQKSQAAQRSFIDWYTKRVADGDVPSLSESRDFADRQIESAQMASTGTLGDLKPAYLVGTVNNPDNNATLDAIMAAVSSGEMDMDEAEIHVSRLRVLVERARAKQAAQAEGAE